MLDLEVTTEVADAIAEIGRVDPRYHSPEGVLFRKALKLIEDEKHWCSLGVGNGRTNLCSVAAVVNAYETWTGKMGTSPLKDVVYSALSKFTGNKSLPHFNDTNTHSTVMQMWRSCGHANGWL